jgi:murein DD-endopeptidase MepM/ murein hydrolase activator NlpD
MQAPEPIQLRPGALNGPRFLRERSDARRRRWTRYSRRAAVLVGLFAIGCASFWLTTAMVPLLAPHLSSSAQAPAPTPKATPAPQARPTPQLVDLDASMDGDTHVVWIGRGDAEHVAVVKDRVASLPLKVRRGDTLIDLLRNAGVARDEAHAAIASLRGLYNARDLRVGQTLELLHLTSADASHAAGNGAARIPADEFQGFSIRSAADRRVLVARADDGGFAAHEEEISLHRELRWASGRIDSSLYEAAIGSDVPLPVLAMLIQVFSYDVDFQREIQPNDQFEVLYSRDLDGDGAVVRYGPVMVGVLTLSGERRALYRFEPEPGDVDYYDEKGRSARKLLMRTPIDGARLSSRFGKRKHPILGYSVMHRGVDFAAPRGTPIYAAGRGVVEAAGRNGGYGNYVRIRHNGTYSTAYAHLKGFAKGIRRGRRVRQGQVIGYVGTTGRSTGPHLHYEVHKGGGQVNPLSLKLPAGGKLEGNELVAFQEVRSGLDRDIAALSAPAMQTAEAPEALNAITPAAGTK